MARDTSTEDRIFSAASKVLLREGSANARMQDIAEEAGITQSLLHYYFRNRERLVDAVFKKEMGFLVHREQKIFASELPLEEKVSKAIEMRLDYLLANPHLAPFVAYEINYNPKRLEDFAQAEGKMRLDALQAQLDEQIAAGKLRPITSRHLVARILALTLFPFIARPVLQVVLGLDTDAAFRTFVEEEKQQLPQLLFEGLRPCP